MALVMPRAFTDWMEPKPESAEAVRRLPELILRAGFLSTGALLLSMAYRSWIIGNVGWRHEVVVLVLGEYILAFGLLAIGLASMPRMQRLLPLILIAILFAFVSWSYIEIQISSTVYGTDNAVFSHVAAEDLLHGHNPYAVHDASVLEAAANKFGLSPSLITDTTDGRPVSDLVAWPGGSVLVLAAPMALGLNDVRWVVVFFQVVTFVLIWWRAPAVLRPVVAVPLIVDPDLFVQFTGGGVMDYIWVAPVVAAAIALYRRRLGWSALFYGLAAGTKQQPWLLAPFLVIWIWKTTQGSRQKRVEEIAYFGASATAGFLILNVPFMIWGFSDWLHGIFLPLHGTLVAWGSGISLLTQSNMVALPKSFYSAATFAVWGVLLLAYFVHFRTLKHALWLAPAIIMWFGYRSLQNYFVYWTPAMLIALFAWWDEVADESEPAALAGEEVGI